MDVIKAIREKLITNPLLNEEETLSNVFNVSKIFETNLEREIIEGV